MDRNGMQLVCFDLGRVLVRICRDWRHGCEVAGVPVPARDLDPSALATLHDAVCRSEVGELDIHGFARSAAPALGIEASHVLALSNAYLLGPYPGASELIDELSANGVATACLSNTNENHWRILTDPANDHGRLVNKLTHRFASHLARLRKPDDALFAHVEQATGVPADSIIFFDDLRENVVAAERRGWRGHWIDPALDEPIGQIRRHLRAHGLFG